MSSAESPADSRSPANAATRSEIPGAHRVSVHGGHSGEFCSHANDTLENVLLAYRDRGFAWVGVTEHMCAPSEAFVPDDERADGLDAAATQERFGAYFRRARSLQRHFSGSLEVLVGFETEAHSGYLSAVRNLIETHRPDYVVGSVHHVHDVLFDASAAIYREVAERCGGIEALYCDYLDLQLEMLHSIEPQVVGHFDLIRIFDDDYQTHLARPEVRARIRRNLKLMAEQGAILDVNARALAKGQPEPYPSRAILEMALALGVRAAPGDDSHGVAGVGLHLDQTIALLRSLGFPTTWPVPGRSGAHCS